METEQIRLKSAALPHGSAISTFVMQTTARDATTVSSFVGIM